MDNTNKLIGLSLFSNVGVAEAGIEKNNQVSIVLANELDHKRCEFYKCVHPNTKVIEGDITKDEIRDTIVEEAKSLNVNFVLATPPCQGMSEAGNRIEFDERNELIFYAVDVIKRLEPRFAIIENVPTILKTKIKYKGEVVMIPEYLHRELDDKYNFNHQSLIKAMDCGVPQMRERNIFLLVRNDQNVSWEFPKQLPVVNLEEAIGHLPSLDPQLREGMEVTLEKFPDFEKKKAEGLKISKWHRPPVHSWKQVEWMMHTPTGKSAIYNEVYYPQKEDGTPVVAHHNHYRRMYWDKPARTMTMNNGVISSLACVHPGRPYISNGEELYSDPRVLSIYELLIVSSLPLDWNIPDWASESFIRKVIGEGIPSAMITVIIKELLKQL
ncbi:MULTISPECIES: DNA cytosine methyltransferase [Segatella]|uniref:Cytosine-specific methyltransferase n=2 Tax=Segatella TaxID=2974251 RepID=D8DZ82_9BACT|nr:MULTISPECIES: DNA (cytosine-5-)-methyltransferase [Segatella]EFI71238.1 C-5 cytosine-specific DNA methylase [Segatella baroniae B14]UKK77469.1 DNA (cytosine-5-)-methyltransferase [Segatella baroniae B14]GJG26368.1 restriction endonuclease subunit M [Segatella bryantii]SEP55126.1 DNA (cytosine-5)-methyltransferase 1 [Segatella baroniae B14]